MGVFVYEGKTIDGKAIRGTVEANDEMEAKIKLRAQRIIPTKVAAPGAGAKKGFSLSFGGGVSDKELQVVTRQFATLIASGVPIVQSLQSLAAGGVSPQMKAVLSQILSEVEKGKRLADAMSAHPKVFDRLYVNLVRAGEEGGVLDDVLNRLATYIEKLARIKGKVKGAMWYPAVIVLVAILVISAIMVFVIPNFVELFKSSGRELPALTQMVIDASDIFKSYWYIVFAILFAIPAAIKKYYETSEGRKKLDSILIRAPIFGPLVQKSAIARFTRTLGTLLNAGVKILDSLDIAGQTAGNYVIERAIERSKESISKGRSIAEPMAKEPMIPTMVAQMITIGEQTGALDQMLTKVADFYEEEVETAAGTLTSLIEPLLMVFLGGIVAVIVIAMYLPIFDLAGGL